MEVVARTGRFGPYVQLGRPESLPEKKKGEKKIKLKSASLPKNMSPDDVTFEYAMALLSFPREVGLSEGSMVTVSLGRFGPYIKWGDLTVSLPMEKNPVHVTLDECIELIKIAAERKKKAAEPLRVLGQNAEGASVVIKDGRFGPYITDGTTNVSLGKKRDPQTTTLEEAIDMLAKKKERGPSKWRKRG